jgi:hypothetical protein
MSWRWNAGCFLGLTRAIALITFTSAASCPMQASAQSSRLDGTVSPTWELPGPESLIPEACVPINSARDDSFVVTGRGGLPPSPHEPLSPETVWVDWATVKPSTLNESKPSLKVKRNMLTQPQTRDAIAILPPLSPAIVEAQTWVRNAKGEIYLVAAPDSRYTGSMPIACK